MAPTIIIPKQYGWFACVLLFTVLFEMVTLAHGAECLEDSPTIQAGNDPYEAIPVRNLTQVEYHRIRTLFNSLAGEWQGTASEFFCMDLKDPTDKKNVDYTLKAEVEVDYFGNFLLKLDLYSLQKRSTHPQLMRFYLDENRLRINTNSRAGDVELLAVEDHQIELSYRLLLQNVHGRGSTRKEIFVLLMAGEKTFSIRQRIYSQGRLSSEHVWKLIRRS